MNEEFWLTLTASILAIVVILLLAKQFRLHDDIEAAKNWQRFYIASAAKAARLEQELADARATIEILRSRDDVPCPCSEVLAARASIAKLQERNQQLVFDALKSNVRYISINKN